MTKNLMFIGLGLLILISGCAKKQIVKQETVEPKPVIVKQTTVNVVSAKSVSTAKKAAVPAPVSTVAAKSTKPGAAKAVAPVASSKSMPPSKKAVTGTPATTAVKSKMPARPTAVNKSTMAEKVQTAK